jgi:antirestriction protein ArdC
MLVCGDLGIVATGGDLPNDAAYVMSWLEKLRSDGREIFRAAADVQRIAGGRPDCATGFSSPRGVGV